MPLIRIHLILGATLALALFRPMGTAQAQSPHERLETLMNDFGVADWKYEVKRGSKKCELTIRAVAIGDHTTKIPLQLMDPSSVNWGGDEHEHICVAECTGEKKCLETIDNETGEVATEMYLFFSISSERPKWMREEWGEIMEKLIRECGGKVDRYVNLSHELYGHIDSCDNAAISRVLDEGLNPNFVPELNYPRSPLIHAIGNCPRATVNLLLSRGAELPADSSISPLHGAKDPEVVAMFLEQGLSVNERDDYDRTPLHSAAALENLEVIDFLIKSGADPSARDKYQVTPLHEAARSLAPESVALLLRAGASPNARDKYGQTPLHRVETVEAAKLLLEAGADPTMEDVDGNNAIEIKAEIVQKYQTGTWTNGEAWERAEAVLALLKIAVSSSNQPPEPPTLRANSAQGCRVTQEQPWCIVLLSVIGGVFTASYLKRSSQH